VTLTLKRKIEDRICVALADGRELTRDGLHGACVDITNPADADTVDAAISDLYAARKIRYRQTWVDSHFENLFHLIPENEPDAVRRHANDPGGEEPNEYDIFPVGERYARVRLRDRGEDAGIGWGGGGEVPVCEAIAMRDALTKAIRLAGYDD
jgi:hypothetical protein